MRKRPREGFTLIEIIFTMMLVLVVAGLSLSALRPANAKAPTRGLAVGLMEEFEAAKQLAIRSGQPVAVGIPTDNGAIQGATSIYRLQGWNVPYITWSKGFSGDFPHTSFAGASWSGISGPGNLVAPPATAKFFNFDQAALAQWLPDATKQDYLYCYLPDGSLITNNVPSSNGRYTIVIADSASFVGTSPDQVKIASGTNPLTIYLSPSGGVELSTGCAGGTIAPGGTVGGTSGPVVRTQPPVGPAQKIRLSDLVVRPNSKNGSAQEGVCVPGQYVTLEIYAYSPQGIPLFANWNHTVGSLTNQKGIFAYPQGLSTILTGEADRMEFVTADRVPSSNPANPNYSPDAPTWSTTTPPPPGTGIFRAQWSWTVPPVSDTGDVYSVTVNVQNATANATVENPALPYKINPDPIPKGRLVIEKFNTALGIWQLWQMNPDGSGERLLSPAGIQEIMPTVDKYGNKIAFVQGVGANRQVKVRFLEGGGELTVSSPPTGDYSAASISPDGRWVGYRDDAGDRIHARRVDGSLHYDEEQKWLGSGHTVKKARPGWSVDSRYMLFGNEVSLQSIDTQNSGSLHTFAGSVDTGGGAERAFAPTAFRPNTAGGAPGNREYVIFSAGNEDPLLIGFDAGAAIPNGAGPNYGSGPEIHSAGDVASFPDSPGLGATGLSGSGSGSTDDDFPSISASGRQMLLTRSPQTTGVEDTTDLTVAVFHWSDGQNRFIGPPDEVIGGNVRRAIWLP